MKIRLISLAFKFLRVTDAKDLKLLNRRVWRKHELKNQNSLRKMLLDLDHLSRTDWCLL